jgi:uncharacterized SAM-binding protein YcdF (DUF218 family)
MSGGEIVFLVKKIVGPMLYPVPLVLAFLLLGLLSLWLRRGSRGGRLLVTLGTGLLIAFTWGPFPDRVARWLEDRYPALRDAQDLTGVRWVVVLGAGHVSDPRLPVTSQLDDSALVRLVEGIRVHRMLAGSKLLLSGGGGADPVPNARVMGELARALGVDQRDMVLETVSRDTEEEAVEVLKIIGRERFVMVTSATHMPRSMMLFEAKGMRPIPAPAGHLAKERQGLGPGDFFPSAEGLRRVQRSSHEYMGMIWARVRGVYQAP